MVGKNDFIVDPSLFDFDSPLALIDDIRKFNPQRFEMEQLSGILFEDRVNHRCVAYKDVCEDEFWCRGHMPGLAIMPGVVMLEGAAQLASYFTQRYDLLGAAMVGFGGLDDVRFRDVVVPGDRVVYMVQLDKVRRNRMIVARFQGLVGTKLVTEGVLRGIPIPVDALNEQLASGSE